VGLADEKESLVAGLLRALVEDTDASVQVEAIWALKRTARPSQRVLRGLGRAMCSAHEQVASEAVSCLYLIHADVMPALRVAFSGENPCSRPELISHVREIGPAARPLVPALVRLLQHRNSNTRIAAACALLAIDHRRYGPRVDALFSHDFPGLRTAFTPCFPEERLTSARDLFPRTTARAARMLKSGTPLEQHHALSFAITVGPHARAMVPEVEKFLRSVTKQWGDDLIGTHAVLAMVALGHPEKAVGPLLRVMRADERKEAEGRRLLQRLGPAARAATPYVRARMCQSEGHHRACWAATLWAIGHKEVGRVKTLDTRQEALNALIALLGDSDTGVRCSAADALAEIGPEAARAVPALVRWWKDKEKFEPTNSIVEALGAIGPAAAPAEKALCALLAPGSPLRRYDVGRALHRIKPGHPLIVPAILHDIDEPSHRGLVFLEFRAPEEMGRHARKAGPRLVRLLRHHDVRLSHPASVALWKIDPVLARKVGAW
jgi:HEAT repeat protein